MQGAMRKLALGIYKRENNELYHSFHFQMQQKVRYDQEILLRFAIHNSISDSMSRRLIEIY